MTIVIMHVIIKQYICMEVESLLNYKKTYKAQMFNRGQSSKVFKEVCDNNIAVCVIRNSEPYVAILKHEEFETLLEKARKYDELSKEAHND